MFARSQLYSWFLLTMLLASYETNESPKSLEVHLYEVLDGNGNEKSNHNDQIQLNKVVDLVLNTAKKTISKDGIKEPLPEVNNTLSNTWNFVAKQGSFQNPASLYRNGDVTVSTKDHSITLLVSLALEDLEIAYTEYTLTMLGLVQSGSIHGQVGKSAISLQLTLHYKGASCAFNLDHMNLDQFGDTTLQISDLGPYQSMFDIISRWLLKHIEGNIRIKLTSILSTKLQKALIKHNICNLIPKAYVPCSPC